MGGGIALQKKTSLVHHELVWHFILFRKVAPLTCGDEILGII